MKRVSARSRPRATTDWSNRTPDRAQANAPYSALLRCRTTSSCDAKFTAMALTCPASIITEPLTFAAVTGDEPAVGRPVTRQDTHALLTLAGVHDLGRGVEEQHGVGPARQPAGDD